MHTSKGISRVNNFDLIRLVAALQVVLFHGLEHLKIDYSNWLEPIFLFIRYFPGVPVFFTISGYLIYNSFKKNPNLKIYFTNRFLRLYPGLFVCFLVTVILLFGFKVISIPLIIHKPIIAVWMFCQVTFFQFYTPGILRGWGIGTPNGSLWTLCIEMQFYLLVPVTIYLLPKFDKYKALLFAILIGLSLISCNFFSHWPVTSLKYKLSEVFVLPYLFNFLFGVILAEYWENIKKYVQGRFIIWLTVYIVWVLLFGFYFKNYVPTYWPKNIQGLAGFGILSILTLSAAYSNIHLSSKILKGNDISYGVYIYHMLVINTLVSLGYLHNPVWVIVAFIATIIVSYLSWIFVEKKALSLKTRQKPKTSRIYETNSSGS